MSERCDRAPVIVLLAAGESRRFGNIKQLADIDGEAMVRRTARIALATGKKLVVVTGAHGEQVSAALSGLPLAIVHHPGWADGMGGSLAAGIRHVAGQYPAATGALVCLADQPLVDSATLSRMLQRHAEKPIQLLATEHAGAPGPPALFPSDCFAELMRWSGAHGAHSLLKRESHRLERFTSADSIDVDTIHDLEHARNQLGTG